MKRIKKKDVSVTRHIKLKIRCIFQTTIVMYLHVTPLSHYVFPVSVMQI